MPGAVLTTQVGDYLLSGHLELVYHHLHPLPGERSRSARGSSHREGRKPHAAIQNTFLMQPRHLLLAPRLLREGNTAAPGLHPALGGGFSGTHLGDVGDVLPQGVQGGRHGPQPRLHLLLHPLAGDEGADDAGPAGDEQAVTGLPGRASQPRPHGTRFLPPRGEGAGSWGALGDSQDDEGGEGQAGQQAAATAAQRAPVGT